MTSELPTEDVPLNLVEIGWLITAATIYERAREGDPFARAIYTKLKGAAIALGVEWYYGDPWPD